MKKLPVTLPVAEINPGVVMLAPAMAPVTLSADETLPLRLKLVALILAPALTLPPVLTVYPLIRPKPPTTTLPPETLPVAEINPGVVMLAPAISPVTFSDDVTLPLKLKLVAFKVAPVMLPPAETDPALITPLVAMFPPVTFPLALINPVTYCPESATTMTLAVPFTPVVTLPLATAMSTFDVPFASFLAVSADTPVNWLPLPK